MAARAVAAAVGCLMVSIGHAGDSGFLDPAIDAKTIGAVMVMTDGEVKPAQVDELATIPPFELGVVIFVAILFIGSCVIFCCYPTQGRPLSQEEAELAKGPAWFPPILWKHGFRGWVGMLLTLPLFPIYFGLVNMIWVPTGTLVVLSKIMTCQRLTLGHFMNIGLLAVDVVLGVLFAHNPLAPHGALANISKWNMSMFGPILSLVGSCTDACRKRKAKQEGIVEDVPAADEDFIEVQVSANVTTIQAKFSEGLESVCNMTVIQGDDWVMFFGPIFAPLRTYRRLGENKKRVVMFLSTFAHHMAADLCIAAFPDCEIWGTPGAGARHSPRLKVTNPSDKNLGLPGFTHFDVSMTIYDEHWLYYEPEGLVLLGDFMPFVDNAIDIPPCLMKCFLSVGRCGKRWTMMNYQKGLVTDRNCIIDALRVIFKSKVNRIEGAHGRDLPGVDREPPLKELYDYWGWLLPADLDKEVSTELV